MKVITVVTEPKEYFPILESQCRKLGYDLIVLGLGEKWGGFAWRFFKVKNFLEQNTGDPNEIIIFVDGYDVIPIQGPSVTRERFLKFDHKLLISVDGMSTDPIRRHLYRRTFSPCHKHYINAGLYMGYKSALLKMYNDLNHKFKIQENPKLDDQILLVSYCQEHLDSIIAYDTDSRIFLNIMGSMWDINYPTKLDKHPDVIIKPHRIVSRKSMMEPCFIHGPGSANLSFVLDRYDIRDPRPLPRKSSRLYFRVFDYAQFFVPEIILIVVSIIIIILFLRRKKGIR